MVIVRDERLWKRKAKSKKLKDIEDFIIKFIQTEAN